MPREKREEPGGRGRGGARRVGRRCRGGDGAACGRQRGGLHGEGEKGRGRRVGRKMLVGTHLGTVGRARHDLFAPFSQ